MVDGKDYLWGPVMGSYLEAVLIQSESVPQFNHQSFYPAHKNMASYLTHFTQIEAVFLPKLI